MLMPKQEKTRVILFFGANDELRILLKSAEELKPGLYVFVAGSLTGSSVLNEVFHDRIFLSWPSQSRDQTNADEFSS